MDDGIRSLLAFFFIVTKEIFVYLHHRTPIRSVEIPVYKKLALSGTCRFTGSTGWEPNVLLMGHLHFMKQHGIFMLGFSTDSFDGIEYQFITDNGMLISTEDALMLISELKKVISINKKHGITKDFIDADTKLMYKRYLESVSRYKKPEINGYIYLIKSKSSGLFKIGKTKDIISRVSQIKTSDPSCEIVYVHSEISNYNKKEKEIHRLFSCKRVVREWFNLDDNDILTFKKYFDGES